MFVFFFRMDRRCGKDDFDRTYGTKFMNGAGPSTEGAGLNSRNPAGVQAAIFVRATNRVPQLFSGASPLQLRSGQACTATSRSGSSRGDPMGRTQLGESPFRLGSGQATRSYYSETGNYRWLLQRK